MRPPRLPPPEAFASKHGTRGCYVTGCRCDACRGANTAYYHQRMAVTKAAALDVPIAPPTPCQKASTSTTGTPFVRTYKHSCPGVYGKPCPTRSHLRKDSTGGICAGCRVLLAWNGIVPAKKARAHLRRLARQGVGRQAVADACDVAVSIIGGITDGSRTQLRAQTERRILAVDAGARADGSLVDAAPTWEKILHLIENEGFTKTELGRRLGQRLAKKSPPALQFSRKKVTARTALRIERFYRDAMGKL